MTMQPAVPPPVTTAAMRRINGFVAFLWILGVLSIVIAVGAAVVQIGSTASSDPVPIAVDGPPAPVETADGDIWSGRGDSVIELTPELQGRPIAVTLLDGAGASPYLTINDTAIDPDGYGYLAGTLATPDTGPTIIATYEHSTLSIRSDDDWMLHIVPFDPVLVADPVVSGTGDAVVLSTGDAANAIITATGESDSPLWVDVLSLRGLEIAVTNDVRDSPLAFDWEPSPYVLLVISVRDETSWTLETLTSAP